VIGSHAHRRSGKQKQKKKKRKCEQKKKKEKKKSKMLQRQWHFEKIHAAGRGTGPAACELERAPIATAD
jgi:hypothetical protein